MKWGKVEKTVDNLVKIIAVPLISDLKVFHKDKPMVNNSSRQVIAISGGLDVYR